MITLKVTAGHFIQHSIVNSKSKVTLVTLVKKKINAFMDDLLNLSEFGLLVLNLYNSNSV